MRTPDTAANQSHSTESVRKHYAALAGDYDQKANQACKAAYRRLVRRFLLDAEAALELGGGASPLLDELTAPIRIACDLSPAMLTAGAQPPSFARIAADAQRLPFPDQRFDAIYSLNLLEHVPEPKAVFEESARLLKPGGRFLAVTPNGDCEALLDLLEKLHLKLPEGPHRFLGRAALQACLPPDFTLLSLRRFLLLPAGPAPLVRFIDALAPSKAGWGLFLFLLAEKGR